MTFPKDSKNIKFEYRADIDGLRALAVVAVIFFHADIPGFSGGFIGVDIFFVISGFLITSIILKEIHAGQFSIGKFYERRIRRIFPALFLVILFTTGVAAFLLDSETFQVFGKSLTATTLFGANFLFVNAVDYFEPEATYHPLLHTWSLGVEEQFYIIFPLLLITINKFSKSRYLPWIVGAGLIPCIYGFGLNTSIKKISNFYQTIPYEVFLVLFLFLYVIFFQLIYKIITLFSKNQYLAWILAIILVSFSASIYGTYANPVVTFYLVHTRAWEFLFGSLLAIGVLPELQSNIKRNIVSILGVCLIIFSITFYNEATKFPGLSALPVVLGTSFIIYSGQKNARNTSSIVNKILSFQPMVNLGLISYSLYLWHWPLFVFTKYFIVRDLTPFEIIGIILTSLFFSILSFNFIEKPFKGTNSIILNNRLLFAFATIIMTIVAVIGIIINLQKGMPSRYHELESNLFNFKTDSQWINFIKNEENLHDLSKRIPLKIGADNGIPSYVVWGDSHAGSLITAISDISKKYGLTGYNMAHGYGVHPLLGMDISPNPNYNFNEAQYNQSIINFIESNPEIGTVFIAGCWSCNTRLIDVTDEYPGRQDSSLLMRVGLLRSINTVLKMKRNVVLVSDIPILKYSPKHFNYISQRFNSEALDFRRILPTLDEYRDRNKNIIDIFDQVSKLPNVTIINPETMFFDGNEDIKVIFNNNALYIDATHLSTQGSQFISPIFDTVLKKMAEIK